MNGADMSLSFSHGTDQYGPTAKSLNRIHVVQAFVIQMPPELAQESR